MKAITLFASLKAVTYRLWDEQNHRLVGFGYLRRLRQMGKEQGQAAPSAAA